MTYSAPRRTAPTPSGRTRTLRHSPTRRDMSNPDPTQPRVPIPSMLRSMTLQPRPRPTPPPPSPSAPTKTGGRYIPFANRGPYVVGEPGPYWLKLDEDDKTETETEEEQILKMEEVGRRARTKAFADRGPYVVCTIDEGLNVPDRSPTVSPLSALDLPPLDMMSTVSLSEASELGTPGSSPPPYLGARISEHFANLSTPPTGGDLADRFADAPSTTLAAARRRAGSFLEPSVKDEDPLARFEDPPIPTRNIPTRFGTIVQEYSPTYTSPSGDPIRPFPTIPRSQSLHIVPTTGVICSLTYENQFDLFAGFDGVGRERTPYADEEDDRYSTTAEAGEAQEHTPLEVGIEAPRLRRTERARRVARMPSNPDFGPVRFERTRTGFSHLLFEDEVDNMLGKGGSRRKLHREVQEEREEEVTVVERLRKPHLKHRIHYLSGKISMAVDRMRKRL